MAIRLDLWFELIEVYYDFAGTFTDVNRKSMCQFVLGLFGISLCGSPSIGHREVGPEGA